MRCHVMTYNTASFTPAEIEAWADRSPLVSHWRYDMPGCIYLLSESSAWALSDDFEGSGHAGQFLIFEVRGDFAGKTLPDTWTVLTEKRPSHQEAAREKPAPTAAPAL